MTNYIDWCQQWPESQRWLKRYSTDSSKRTASSSLYWFCTHYDTTPPQLLALTDAHIIRMLDDYALDASVKPYARRSHVSATRAFFKANYRALPAIAGSTSFNPLRQKTLRTPTKETLFQFIKGARTPRDRALVAFMATTGIAEGSIQHLTLANLEPDWRGQPTPHVFIIPKVIHGKSTIKGAGRYGQQQRTFLTPAAKQELMEYLRWRHDKFGTEETNDTILFASNINDTKPLREAGVAEAFRRISKRSGITFSPHDMRRFFQTALEGANIHPNRCRKMRGRSVKGEENPYSQANIAQLREDYYKALPNLEFLAPPIINEKELAYRHLELALADVPTPSKRKVIEQFLSTLPQQTVNTLMGNGRVKHLLSGTQRRVDDEWEMNEK